MEKPAAACRHPSQTAAARQGRIADTNWVNGANSGAITLNQLNSSNLLLGWSDISDRFVGIDNLAITTVPEPSSAVWWAASLGLLALSRRRSRAA